MVLWVSQWCSVGAGINGGNSRNKQTGQKQAASSNVNMTVILIFKNGSMDFAKVSSMDSIFGHAVQAHQA